MEPTSTLRKPRWRGKCYEAKLECCKVIWWRRGGEWRGIPRLVYLSTLSTQFWPVSSERFGRRRWRCPSGFESWWSSPTSTFPTLQIRLGKGGSRGPHQGGQMPAWSCERDAPQTRCNQAAGEQFTHLENQAYCQISSMSLVGCVSSWPSRAKQRYSSLTWEDRWGTRARDEMKATWNGD